MATERNVVDFKIHNLTEEQFQELKAQGKIDPNAVYCTPDESLKTDQITNCITEIPQDIKLELADGAIILKAGSTVYVPNGSGNYTKIPIEDDLSRTVTSGFEGFLFYYPEENRLSSININYCSSGTVLPSAPIGTNHWVHYKTDENKIYYTEDAGETWSRTYSFPLCIFTSEETNIPEEANITRINQVFNGFGYIGSTVFALPGVKGLAPSGRNKDGTLKNGIVTLNNVSTYTKSGNFDKWGVYISTGGKLYSINNSFVYNEHENLIRHANDGTPFGVFQCGTATSVNNRISFRPRTTFHAVDYSDFETLSDTVETLSDTVEINNDNAVHKTGDETIGGTKNFTAPSLRISNEAGTGGTGLNILDSNGKGQTYVHHFYTNGRYYSRLVNRNATAEKIAYVQIFIDDNGNSTFSSVNVDSMHAPTPASTSNSTDIATTAWANAKFLTSPAGLVAPFAGKTAPSGWLRCDGSAVSRTTYASLFAAIGTLYGAGDGSTTFNLPNLQGGRVPVGMSGEYVGKSTNGVLPNITGKFMIGATNNTNDYTGGILGTEGAFSSDWSASNHSLGGGSGYSTNRRAIFDASRSSSLYGGGWFDGSKVIPASVGMNYCIKY